MWIALLAMVSCAPCHEAIVRAFAGTGMGRSITAPGAEARIEQKGRYRDQSWAVEWRKETLLHRVGNETRRMEWAVGSGHEGKSFLWRVGDALFQSPLAWYTSKRSWDLSPGYASGASIYFLRPVRNMERRRFCIVAPNQMECRPAHAAPAFHRVNHKSPRQSD